MTYLQFHLTFILPAIAGLALTQRRPIAGLGAREAFKWLAAVLVLAFLYTTPWDNYLVYSEIWGYPPGRVLATVGYVPVEEYAFFLLQPVLTGLFYFALRGRQRLASPARAMPGVFKAALVSGWLAVTAGGIACLVIGGHALYLGLILAWAPPVLAGMSWIGAAKIWNERRRVVASIAVPTVYLWVADRVAIGEGIWYIADATRLQIDPLGLPIEEAIFFLVTNVLVVCGLALFLPSPRTP